MSAHTVTKCSPAAHTFRAEVAVQKASASLPHVFPGTRPCDAATSISDEARAQVRTWRDMHAPYIVGDDPALLAALNIVRQVCDKNCNVLVRGPSGSGKELIAKALHFGSRRKRRPFVPLNCAAIPAELMESELFGHSKGAFSGADSRYEGKLQAADGGTLFLDEIGDMDVRLQSKLLRVLQDKSFTPVGDTRARSVDVRIVAATNQDLVRLCDEGRFRRDLYYRLDVVSVHLPALGQRRGDVISLTERFLADMNARYDLQVAGIAPDAKQALRSYDWPGNVRELQNVIERTVLLKKDLGDLRADDLPVHVRVDSPLAAPADIEPTRGSPLRSAQTPAPSSSGAELKSVTLEFSADGIDLRAALEQAEIDLAREALRRTDGNKAKAARLLGLKRTTFIERLRKLDLNRLGAERGDRQQVA